MSEEAEIEQLRQEINTLNCELQHKQKRLQELQFNKRINNLYTDKFSTDETARYSRQMLIPLIGVAGQNALKQSKVLIVGAGGLGCPAALYLAAAGVGEITLVDDDEVDLTNLHRQILHAEADIGVAKVESAYNKLSNLNSDIKIIPIQMHVNGKFLMDLLNGNSFDVLVDATDNVATRYLLNDVCVIKKVPLVSGSALQLEAQLTVYNYKEGPCYRCIFPVPPPPNTVTSCGDGGVLGVVPGVIGVLQALETIKIITEISEVLSGRLLLFDGAETRFRNVKLRGKNLNCVVCGSNPIITEPIDYEQFCGAKANDKVENISILHEAENIDITEFECVLAKSPILIDVRPVLEFEMCHFPNSINIPYSDIEKGKRVEDIKKMVVSNPTTDILKVYVICRRGNDSQRVVSKLNLEFSDNPVSFINVRGGLHSYAKLIDPTFPVY